MLPRSLLRTSYAPPLLPQPWPARGKAHTRPGSPTGSRNAGQAWQALPVARFRQTDREEHRHNHTIGGNH